MSNKNEFSVPYLKPVDADSMLNSHIYNRAIARRRRHANCRSSGCVRRAVWRAPMTSLIFGLVCFDITSTKTTLKLFCHSYTRERGYV